VWKPKCEGVAQNLNKGKGKAVADDSKPIPIAQKNSGAGPSKIWSKVPVPDQKVLFSCESEVARTCVQKKVADFEKQIAGRNVFDCG
ncbi:hypothetical protein, partial [Bacillus cereus group sp. BC22]|uniref:hypothetical protein n=1 Tax=Bacillus cereus group sp. BC22 TaxID=3445341 RepID=UPI003F28E725